MIIPAKSELTEQVTILREIVNQIGGVRNLARTINEDAANVWRWINGKSRISARAAVSIIRNFPQYKPHTLNPEVFQKDVIIKFKG